MHHEYEDETRSNGESQITADSSEAKLRYNGCESREERGHERIPNPFFHVVVSLNEVGQKISQTVSDPALRKRRRSGTTTLAPRLILVAGIVLRIWSPEKEQRVNTPILHLFDVAVTPWKLIGYLGVLLFAGRWVVQMAATQRHGRPSFPGLFWTMSVMGSSLLLLYFIWGKNDSVGVMSNLFPMAVALYNLVMHRRSRTDTHSSPGALAR